MRARSGTRRLVVDGRVVADVEPADTYWRRLRGMTLRRRLPPALLLVPGGAVHGLGMRVPLDVAMLVPAPDPAAAGQSGDCAGATRGARLDRVWEVRRVSRLVPFGLVPGVRRVAAVLEAPAGSFASWALAPGSRVAATVRPPVPADPGGTRDH
jgi:hypothetical protein